MVTPVAKRQAVAHLCSSFEVSQRRACELIRADRSSVRYFSVRPDDAAIRSQLCELASVRRRFGYRRLLLMLRGEGVLWMRNRRLSVSVSLTKSSDQRWFGPCGNVSRRPCSHSSFTSTSPANLQPRLGIQPPQLLVVDQHAFAADHEKQTAIAKAPAHRRQH